MRLFLRRALDPAHRVPWRSIAVAIGIAAVVLGLQYTRFALFASDENDTLWGVLTGMVVFTVALAIGRRVSATRVESRR
jgi:hypothetical protein